MIEFIFGAIIIVIIIISLNPLLDNVEPFRLDFFLKRHLDNRPPASGLLLRLQITTKINDKMRVANSAFTRQQQSQSNAYTNNVKKSEKKSRFHSLENQNCKHLLALHSYINYLSFFLLCVAVQLLFISVWAPHVHIQSLSFSNNTSALNTNVTMLPPLLRCIQCCWG